jgi:hypothetical protein
MDDFLTEFAEIDWRTYETFSAISAFRSYSAETERLVADAADIEEILYGPKWRPSTEDEITELLAEKDVVRHLHDKIITPTFRYSAVVSLFAVLERELRRFGDNLMHERKGKLSYKDLRGSLLEQITKYAEAYCSFSPASAPTYSQICDLQKVRDCVVHCYGDPSLSRDKAYLLRLSSPSVGIEAYDGLPLEISPVFIERSVAAIWQFFFELFAKVGWKVNKQWL